MQIITNAPKFIDLLKNLKTHQKSNIVLQTLDNLLSFQKNGRIYYDGFRLLSRSLIG